jgi:hypothetical protein
MATRRSAQRGCVQSESVPGVIPSIDEYNEWMARLSAVTTKDDAKTVQGWARELRLPYNKARAWVCEGLHRGWMEQAATTIELLIGGTRTVVGFRIKEQTA